MVVYGELMCNKGLFRYDEEKLFGTSPIFGAMIKPANKEAIAEIIEKLGQAKFACKVRSSLEDAEEEDDSEKLIMILMNQTYKELIEKVGLKTVVTAEKVGTFYELVVGNFDYMVNGNAEGLVIVSPSSGSDIQVSKWKIGAEANQTNKDFLGQMLLDIEDKGQEIFGDNAAKAKELFEKMYEVAKSQKVVAPEKKAPEPKKPKGGISEEDTAKYAEPIKSAKSKFDHCDVYFAKDKNPMKYGKMIAGEVLNDIKIDAKDKKALKDHENMVMNFIKLDFAEFKKNEGK